MFIRYYLTMPLIKSKMADFILGIVQSIKVIPSDRRTSEVFRPLSDLQKCIFFKENLKNNVVRFRSAAAVSLLSVDSCGKSLQLVF